MKIVTLDFESFWSVEHSLTKMNPIAYVMHPETEIISCAVKVNDSPTQVYFGNNIGPALDAIDWSDALVVGHNMSGFDAMICAWIYGITPKMWGCTLSMSRPHHMLDVGGSLAKLVAHYGLGVKDQTVLHNTKGRHLCDFTQAELEAMATYNKADTDQCYELFRILMKKTSAYEMKLIDQTIRMLVDPQFVCDEALLQTTLKDVQDKQRKVLEEVAELVGASGVEDLTKSLASSAKFAKLLESFGVTVPLKISPTTGKETYALAKSDEEFLALQDHDDIRVAALASARLGVKSTLLETRISSFLEVSEYTKGYMPIGLNYYAAHTGRWGGGLKLNQQNLPRVSGKPTDALRNSIRAPQGYKVIVSDLSGIELRMNMFLWQVPYAMELFQADPEKADLYKQVAAAKFGVPVAEVTKQQRQIGKILSLGCGYGAGGGAFQKVAKMMGGIDMTADEAKEAVAAYREQHPEVVNGWKRCHMALPKILGGIEFQIDPWGLCVANSEGIQTPKGMIRYPGLRVEATDGKEEWVYGEGRNKTRIYSGRITENLVQHLSRYVLSDAMLEFEKQTGYPVALCVHDEIVAVVPEADAENALAVLQSILRTPPKWFPQLVVWSEGDIADSYGSAK